MIYKNTLKQLVISNAITNSTDSQKKIGRQMFILIPQPGNDNRTSVVESTAVISYVTSSSRISKNQNRYKIRDWPITEKNLGQKFAMTII